MWNFIHAYDYPVFTGQHACRIAANFNEWTDDDGGTAQNSI
jgi:hypothetical protein